MVFESQSKTICLINQGQQGTSIFLMPNPGFLISCLVRQGQLDKALGQGLKHVGTDALEPGEGRLLSELTAAMFLARPVPLAARDGDPPARVEWIAAANAARKAVAALTAQKPPTRSSRSSPPSRRARRSGPCG